MRRLLIGLLCLGLSACDVERTTTPDPVGTDPTPAPVAATPSPVDPAQPVSPPPTTDGKIDIDDAGTVTWTKPFTATACVYTYQEYSTQTFSHSYQVSNGSRLQPNPAWPCNSTITMQLDLQRGAVCPKDPFANQWDGFLRGRAKVVYNTAVCPTPKPTPSPTPSPKPTPSPSPSPTPPPPPICQSTSDGCLGICHVSNKGMKDRNWNLQVDWKRNGQGHIDHLSCDKFNPPDFWSKEKDCKVENVKWCAVS